MGGGRRQVHPLVTNLLSYPSDQVEIGAVDSALRHSDGDSAVERSEIETSILPKTREIGKKIESEWEQSSAVHATDSTSHP